MRHHQHSGRVASHSITRDAINWCAEASEQSTQRNVFAVGHTPHFVVAALLNAITISEYLGIGEARTCVFGNTDGEWCIDALNFGNNFITHFARGEVTHVDCIFGPHHQIQSVTWVEQCCSSKMTVDDVAGVAVHSEYALWPTTLYHCNSQRFTSVATARGELSDALQHHQGRQHYQHGAS